MCEIRKYRPEDLPRLMEIGNRAWQPIYRMFRQCYGDELFARIVPNEQTDKGEQVRGHCQRHPEWVLVCQVREQVVGFATFRLDEERQIGELGNNAVDPDFQGRGLAQALYGAVLDYFRQRGMRFAQVRTGMDQAHGPARIAYERAGFDISHEDVTYFREL